MHIATWEMLIVDHRTIYKLIQQAIIVQVVAQDLAIRKQHLIQIGLQINHRIRSLYIYEKAP